MKIPPKKLDLAPQSKSSGPSRTQKTARVPRDAFFAPVKVPQSKPLPPPHKVFQMLDSVRIRRDIPGTEIKKDMQGAIVDTFGSPPRAAYVEFTDPPSIEGIDVDDLELVKRY